MDKINEKLKQKFLTYDENGENASFNDDYLEEGEIDVHSELTQLFEKCYYFTNNKNQLNKIIQVLRRNCVFYKLEKSVDWKYKLII